jgi:hypothetical protein
LQQPRGDKNPKKRAADVNKSADAKPPRGPKPSPAPKTVADAPVSAPVEDKPAVETPAVESPVVETVAAEAPVAAAVVEETPRTDSAE